MAVRAPRNGVFYTMDEVDTDYSKLNTFKTVIRGDKIAILALGDFFQMGEELIEEIDKRFGIKATLINPRYITGIDENCLQNLKDNHDIVVTLEDGVNIKYSYMSYIICSIYGCIYYYQSSSGIIYA